MILLNHMHSRFLAVLVFNFINLQQPCAQVNNLAEKSRPPTEIITSKKDLTRLAIIHPFKQSYFSEIGTTQLLLSNGVTVLLRPMKDKQGGILFRGRSPGGYLMYREKDHFNAKYAPFAVRLDTDSASLIKTYLAQNKVYVLPLVGENIEEVEGVCLNSVSSVELMLQGIYKYFTDPHPDREGYKKWRDDEMQRNDQNVNTPETARIDILSSVVNKNWIFNPDKNVEQIRQMSFERSFEIYKDRFADAGDFVFVFTGDFSPGTFIPVINKYLGSLPAKGRKENPVSKSLKVPNGKTNVQFRVFEQNRSELFVYFKNKLQPCDDSRILYLFQSILREQLIHAVENETRRQHDIDAWMNVKTSKMLTMNVDVENTSGDTLNILPIVVKVIKKLQREGPDSAVFYDAVNTEKNWLKKEMETNNKFWIRYLTENFQKGKDPLEVVHWYNHLDKLNPADIRNLSQRYLLEHNMTIITMLPK